jgi:GNAT superfamily N-acetyltransferase
MYAFAVQKTQEADREWIKRWLRFQWGAEIVVVHDQIYYPADLPGYIATEQDSVEPIGLITYLIRDKDCEIVTLDSRREGVGVGSALIETVKEQARARDCLRLWLVTTNDNLNALRFYQKRGFHIVKVNVGAVERARQQKPEIPELGNQGIPIRDEIELELLL